MKEQETAARSPERIYVKTGERCRDVVVPKLIYLPVYVLNSVPDFIVQINLYDLNPRFQLYILVFRYCS